MLYLDAAATSRLTEKSAFSPLRLRHVRQKCRIDDAFAVSINFLMLAFPPPLRFCRTTPTARQ